MIVPGDGVGDPDRLGLEGAEAVALSGADLEELGLALRGILCEPLAHELERVGRAVHRHDLLAQQVRHGADVVFVAVGQPDRGAAARLLTQVAEIGADDVGAERVIRKRDAAVDEQAEVPLFDRQAIHAHFAQPTQGHQSHAARHGINLRA
jgi:hypothetical protein